MDILQKLEHLSTLVPYYFPQKLLIHLMGDKYTDRLPHLQSYIQLDYFYQSHVLFLLLMLKRVTDDALPDT